MNRAACRLQLLPLLAGSCALFSYSAMAQDVAQPADDAKTDTSLITIVKKDANQPSIFSFDFGIPSSPAISLVGTAGDTLSSTPALKPYDFELPAAYGGTKGSQAFAADVAPAWFLLNSKKNSFDQYESRPLLQIENRTRVGAALYLGDSAGGDATKAKDSRLALGLSVSLLGSSDPLATNNKDGRPAWITCVDDVYDSVENRVNYRDQYEKILGNTYVNFDPYYSDIEHIVLPLRGVAARSATIPERDEIFKRASACLKDGSCADFDGKGELKKALDASSRSPLNKDPTAGSLKIAAAIESINTSIANRVEPSSEKIANTLGLPAQLKACVANANAYARYGASLDFGGGAVWDGKPGTIDGLRKASGALWIAGRIPLITPEDPTVKAALLRYWMLGGSVRAGWGETVATGAATVPKIDANTLNAWAGVENYTAAFKFSARIGYQDTQATNAAQKSFSKSGTRWAISSSVRLGDAVTSLLNGTLTALTSDTPKNGVWLNLSYGSSEGTVKTLDDKMVLVSLSFSPGDPDYLFGQGGGN
jgi:hypothetical protein